MSDKDSAGKKDGASKKDSGPKPGSVGFTQPAWLRFAQARAAGALAVVGAGFLLVFLWAAWTINAPGPAARAGASTDVVLPHGAGLQEIAEALRGNGVIRSAPVFMAVAQASGAAQSLKAGEYAFATRESMAKIIADLRAGAVVRHLITVPEGVTSEQVAEILARAPFLTGVAPAPPEGAVLPETYEAQYGEDRASVLGRMMVARDALLASLWRQRRAGLPYASPGDAVVLASIVEKETAKTDERPKVAAVFLNRLAKGMRLESDPTVIYGLTGGWPLGHGLRASELAAPTPYNTYLIAGLPPTPIGNPSRASLAAVLDPPQTDSLYFVADGTGGHVFAASLEDHRRNVAHWRALEMARIQPAGRRSSRRPRAGAPAVSPSRRGLLLVISSPSGAGKTSLTRRLLQEHPGLGVSISVTTRPPRPSEVDGREYHFVSAERFAALVADGAFLEWAQVHGNRYGTPAAPVTQALAEGRDLVFDIDWQGAAAIAAKAGDDTVRVFVLPPSMATLASRLAKRAQDAAAVIAERLAEAKVEIGKWAAYDYVIVNEDFEQAAADLGAIYRAEQLAPRPQPPNRRACGPVARRGRSRRCLTLP